MRRLTLVVWALLPALALGLLAWLGAHWLLGPGPLCRFRVAGNLPMLMCFSRDGEWLAVYSALASKVEKVTHLAVRNLRTQQVLPIDVPAEAYVTDVCFPADGSMLAAMIQGTEKAKTVRVLRFQLPDATGELLAELPSERSSIQTRFCAKGRWLQGTQESATGRTVFLWDLERKRYLLQAPVPAMAETILVNHAVSPSGKFLVFWTIGQQGGCWQLVRVADGLVLLHRLISSSFGFLALFFPDRDLLAIQGNHNQPARVIDCGSLADIGQLPQLSMMPPSPRGSDILSWEPDTRSFAFAERGLITVRAADGSAEIARLQRPDQRVVTDLTWLPSGHAFAIVSLGSHRIAWRESLNKLSLAWLKSDEVERRYAVEVIEPFTGDVLLNQSRTVTGYGSAMIATGVKCQRLAIAWPATADGMIPIEIYDLPFAPWRTWVAPVAATVVMLLYFAWLLRRRQLALALLVRR